MIVIIIEGNRKELIFFFFFQACFCGLVKGICKSLNCFAYISK